MSGVEHDFIVTYTYVFGETPPREFREAYRTLAEALYYGLHGGLGYDEKVPTLGSGKKFGGDRWPFKTWQVLPLKTRTDKWLAAASALLLGWARENQAQGGPHPPLPG